MPTLSGDRALYEGVRRHPQLPWDGWGLADVETGLYRLVSMRALRCLSSVGSCERRKPADTFHDCDAARAAQRRQNAGVKSTSKVKTSSRPTSIATISTNLPNQIGRATSE